VFDREKALEILHKHLKTENLVKHSYAVEVVMRDLAKKFDPERENLWAITGLLHDLDADLVDYKKDGSEHGPKAVEILKEEGFGNEEMYHAICAHNKECGVKIENTLDQAIYAADPITGFIIAVTLVYPDKKLSSVKTKSISKRMKDKRFAAGASREAMKSIEKLDMSFYPQLVTDALKHVIHPAKEKDIVSLGMVEDDIRIDGKRISFSLKFDRANDPFVSAIKKASVHAIKKYVGEDAEIEGNIFVKINPRAPIPEQKMLAGVKNVIAVASGKGGVGKSTVASNLAVALANLGYKVGLLDADVFGPSIPKMFQTEDARPVLRKVDGKDKIVPVEKYGVKNLSIGYFVEANDALVWRGAMATGAIKQLIGDGDWGELDYLLLDLPPGTSDIHLTVVQTISLTGAVVVSTPQDVALADARKGISMFTGEKINVPVLGLVENMAWFTPAELPDNKYYIFGEGGCKRLAEELNVELLGQIPIVQSIREGGDKGEPSALNPDSVTGRAFAELGEAVVKAVEKRNQDLPPTKVVEITRK
jgi:ATP-binding protein involved in chromosome partitioning